jgi:hypothetical protein
LDFEAPWPCRGIADTIKLPLLNLPAPEHSEAAETRQAAKSGGSGLICNFSERGCPSHTGWLRQRFGNL